MKYIFNIIIHAVGYGSLGGAVCLAFLVFGNIILQGAFIGVEQDYWILYTEMGFMIYAGCYLAYLCFTKARSNSI